MNAEITVKFTIENTGEHEECGFETYAELVRWLIHEEGLWGLVNDEYEIINIVGRQGGPRHGKEIMWNQYPPAHPMCRCWVNHEIMELK